MECDAFPDPKEDMVFDGGLPVAVEQVEEDARTQTDEKDWSRLDSYGYDGSHEIVIDA